MWCFLFLLSLLACHNNLLDTFSFSDTDGRRLPQNHRQKVYSNGSLIIADVQKSSDWGRYECLVFDPEGHSVRKDLVVNVMGKNSRPFFFHVCYTCLLYLSNHLVFSIMFYKEIGHFRETFSSFSFIVLLDSAALLTSGSISASDTAFDTPSPFLFFLSFFFFFPWRRVSFQVNSNL